MGQLLEWPITNMLTLFWNQQASAACSQDPAMRSKLPLSVYEDIRLLY